jgi:hypothetical protein
MMQPREPSQLNDGFAGAVESFPSRRRPVSSKQANGVRLFKD